MERNSLPVGLSQLYKWHKDKGTLNFDLSFQRNIGYWSSIVKSMLIWSILSNSYIPPIILVKADEDKEDDKGKSMSVYSVLDGSHRLGQSLFPYMNDEFALHSSTPTVNIDGDEFKIANLTFSQLPQELQNLINSYKFNIQCISHATEEELTMLYININSGKELSTLAKAKPHLGVELCEYFAEISEMPFMSQGLALSATQALKEEDLACSLQSLMLISEYEDYKSLSLAECLKFADWLHENMTSQLKEDFKDIIDYLGVFSTRTKYLKKNNVCIIVKLAEQMLLEGIEAASYKAFLNEFFVGDNEAYKENSGVGNVKLPKVEARYEIMTKAAEQYFNISILEGAENDEVKVEQSSSDGASEEK